jgi:hypothetical protein
MYLRNNYVSLLGSVRFYPALHFDVVVAATDLLQYYTACLIMT